MIYRKKTKKQPSSERKSRSSKQRLTDKADTAFSQFIRLKYASDNGFCQCISCGKFVHWTQIQCGHYMSRRYLSTRWSEDNCRPQCVACNIFNQGAAQAFRLGLIKEYSAEAVRLGYAPEKAFSYAQNRVDLTEVKARTSVAKLSEFELDELAKYYQNQVTQLKERKGL